jgi:hypothetical protein
MLHEGKPNQFVFLPDLPNQDIPDRIQRIPPRRFLAVLRLKNRSLLEKFQKIIDKEKSMCYTILSLVEWKCMEDTMNEVAKKEFSGFPEKSNLYEFVEFQRFADSDAGKEAIRKGKTSIRNGNIAKLVVWAVLIVAVLVLLSTGHPIWGILAAIIGGGAAWGFTKFSFRASAEAKLSSEVAQHCSEIAKYIVDNHFKDANYFFYYTSALIYNNNICAYFSTETGDFVVYNKKNIKDVTRERVHVGTKTTSSATTTGKSQRTLANTLGLDPTGRRKHKSTTKIVTQAQEIYEWHLDILTDFMEYPKVSMVLPDEKWAEDEVGKAYGVLKP